MNLTIESLNNVKETCLEALKLEAMMASEERHDLINGVKALLGNTEAALEVLAQVGTLKNSLEKCGYSDQWFDIVNEGGKLEGIVSFEMPKFFDNEVNRGKACMEGFFNSFLDWLVKALEWIKKTIDKMVDLFMKIVKYIGDTSEQSWFDKVIDLLDRLVKRFEPVAVNAALTSLNISENKYYSFDLLQKKIENVTNLINVLYIPKNSATNTGINPKLREGIERSTDQNAIREKFYNNLVSEVDRSVPKIAHDKIEDGFVFDFDGGNDMVKFYGVDTPLVTDKFTVKDCEDLQKKLKAVNDDLISATTHLKNTLVYAKKDLDYEKRMAESDIKWLTSNAKAGAVLNQEKIDDATRTAVTSTASLNIVIGALKFVSAVYAGVKYNRRVLASVISALSQATQQQNQHP